MDKDRDREKRSVELEIPFRTFLKVFVAALVVFCAIHLWPMVILLFMAILIAVTLTPFRAWLARRMPLWAATTLVSLSLVGGVAVSFGLLIPELVAQITAVVNDWPRMRAELLHSMPSGQLVRPTLQQALSTSGNSVTANVPEHLMTVGGMAIGGVSQLVLMLTLSIYLMAEGARTYEWIVAFFTPQNRVKLQRTANEVSEVISAYVGGQLITSLLVSVFAFVVLILLKVPGALMLAVLAGVFDILPIIGFFLSTIPAFLLALTVSPTAAGGVLGAYLVYHGIENYFIVPKIYGNKLRLSTLVVLISLLAGGMVAGIPGAILILPIVASYPIVERIWLRHQLEPGVIEKHKPPEEKGTGSKTG